MSDTKTTQEQEFNNSISGQAFQSLDLEKLVRIIKKSIVWIVLIFIGCNVLTFLYLRWTKPIYQSTSLLKLDVKSEATSLGLGAINELAEKQKLNNLYGEIELITSDLFFNKVLEVMDFNVSYYSPGNVLSYEWYGRQLPITITEYDISLKHFYNTPFHIEILDKNSFQLTYTVDKNTYSDRYSFGEIVSGSGFNFTIDITEAYNSSRESKYFFVFNSHEAQLAYIRHNIEVQPQNLNANTIRVSFQDFDRNKSFDIVNIIDSLYLNYSREEKSLTNKKKIEWLNGELKNIEKRLDGFEGYFENFTITNRTVDLSQDLSSTIKGIVAIDSQRFVYNQQVSTLEEISARMKEDEDANALLNSSFQFPETLGDEIQLFSAKIEERNNLSLSYNESTFALQKKNIEIERLRTSISEKLSELKEYYRKQLNELAQKKSILEESFIVLPGKRIEYDKAQRFYELYEELYLALMKSRAEFEIADAGTVTDFKILSPATFPTEPLSPQKAIIRGLGVVAALLLSLLFIAVKYVLNDKISNIEELEKSVNAAILGIIPRYSDKIETSLVVGKNPKSAISEALRTVRTNIEFMFAGKKKKIISVTSTVGSEGKTFVSVNLGGIVALSNRRVVLVDLDMRKPKLHIAVAGSNEGYGVSTLLIRRSTLEESIRSTELKGLDYIPAGPMPPNPSELLLSDAFSELIEALRERYDMVILDTPPVGIVTDASLVMKKADLPIYVFRADYSKKSFTKTLDRLVQTNKFNNIAIILNSLQSFRDHKYGYGYYEDKDKKTTGFFQKIKLKK